MNFTERQRRDILAGILTASPSAVRLAESEDAFERWYRINGRYCTGDKDATYEIWKAAVEWTDDHPRRVRRQ